MKDNLRRNLMSVSAELESNGFFKLGNVDSEEAFLSIAKNLGTLVPQYDGALVWSIKAKEKAARSYHSLSTGELLPHTECYEFAQTPPKYLALWCKDPGQGEGGSTLLGSLKSAINTVCTSEELEKLKKYNLSFSTTPGLKEDGMNHEFKCPMISDNGVIRFSVKCMTGRDLPWLESRKEDIKNQLYRNSFEFKWSRGDLLLWNNHELAHWREGFTDINRELRRVWLS